MTSDQTNWGEAGLPDEPASIPVPLAWDDYVALVTEEWRSLLARTDLDEPLVAGFLAKHPALVPGVHGFEGGHQGPIHSAMFVEAELPGIRRPVPDFMWIVRDTATVRPILIEIESPRKRWFKDNGLATDDLLHAIRQLSQWRQFFQSEANILQFKTKYELNDGSIGRRPLKPSYCLVYGRAAEFADHDDLLGTREGMRPDNTEWMTFDSLRPDDFARDVFSVKVHVDRRWEALHAASTLHLGNEQAGDFARLVGRDAAIDHNDYMSPERRQFLVARLPVWDKWHAEHLNGPRRPRYE